MAKKKPGRPKTALPKRKRGVHVIHKSKGLTTGLGICAFFANLFETNELSKPARRLTDEQIAIAVEREFPTRKSAKFFRDPKHYLTVNAYRNYYNQGKFTQGKIPKYVSFRYAKGGIPVEGRLGFRPLMQDEIITISRQHTNRKMQ